LLPSSYTCPRCKCHALCRLRRSGIDFLFSIFGLRPVRCLTCGSKSFLRLAEKDRTPTPNRRKIEPEAPAAPVQKPNGPRRAA
jgi:hypothetical protein